MRIAVQMDHISGLNIESDTTLALCLEAQSRGYKLFQYLLSGLTVLASDTAGQNEIADSHSEFIHVFKNGSANDLAKTLNHMISNRADLEKGKQAALQQAEDHYCWEESKQVLLASVTEALRR